MHKTKMTATTGVFLLLCGLAFLMYIDRSNVSIAAPVIQKEFGFSNAHLGWVFSAFATAYACCMLLGGLLTDKIGPPSCAHFIWTGLVVGDDRLRPHLEPGPIGCQPASLSVWVKARCIPRQRAWYRFGSPMRDAAPRRA